MATALGLSPGEWSSILEHARGPGRVALQFTGLGAQAEVRSTLLDVQVLAGFTWLETWVQNNPEFPF